MKDFSMIENLIIGSGPLGITAANKILDMGLTCTLVDGGNDLPNYKMNQIELLRNKDYRVWTDNDIKVYDSLNSYDSRLKSHVGSKLHFGSSYPYSDISALTSDDYKINSNIKVLTTLAAGGLGNVWGSICFPYTEIDYLKFREQIRVEDFLFLRNFLPLSGKIDNLNKIYPTYGTLEKPVKLSNLSDSLNLLYDKKEWFKSRNIMGGLPRVAVETKGLRACQSCGLCATGCPWNSIWTPKISLEALSTNKSFDYRTNFIVSSIAKINDNIVVTDANQNIIIAKRVFLAAGALSTSVILSKSELIPSKVYLSDTQLTIIPCLAFHKKQSEENFVLSQFILNIPNDNRSTEFFVQITGFNPDLVRRIRAFVKVTRFIPRKILNLVFKFVGIAMVFQDNSKSGKIVIENDKNIINLYEDRNSLVSLFRIPHFTSLLKSLITLKLLPIPFFWQQVSVGESYHIGSLHAGDNSLLVETDGKISKDIDLYIIDSCALDYIAPGPVTYSAMANAVRIIEKVFKA